MTKMKSMPRSLFFCTELLVLTCWRRFSSESQNLYSPPTPSPVLLVVCVDVTFFTECSWEFFNCIIAEAMSSQMRCCFWKFIVLELLPSASQYENYSNRNLYKLCQELFTLFWAYCWHTLGTLWEHSYLVFVIFSLQAQFWAQFFYKQKHHKNTITITP